MDEQKIRTFDDDVETIKKDDTAPAQVAVPEKSIPASILKTYASDFSRRLKETQASTATVLAAEQDAGPHLVQASPKNFSRSNLIYSIVGSILLIAGVVGAYIAYTHYLDTSAPIVLTPVATAPIFVDERQQISGTGTILLQAIEQSIARPIAKGAIRLLSLDTAATSNGNVFLALQLPAPNSLSRNIDATGGAAGVIHVNGKQSPFFILSVTYYGETFAGMLTWEPFMLRDLAKLFPPYPSPVVSTPVATTTVATTTKKSATNTVTMTAPAVAPMPAAAFSDTTIANHDVRVYRDASGRDMLVYGYWNQETLVIARDAAAFTELLERLATSRTQ